LEIDIDYNKVQDIYSRDMGDDTYSIVFEFNDEEIMIYGYNNRKKFMKDYTKVMEDYYGV